LCWVNQISIHYLRAFIVVGKRIGLWCRSRRLGRASREQSPLAVRASQFELKVSTGIPALLV